ncbi:MAG: formyltetrahydrofolate deformylase [Blastochloris sp.]|nr:formyltetrahydrofolate deformylase [Blastochloris sp.]
MKIYATATLIGRDKSGVIAAVTQFLFQNKANIEALEEQVARGQFSMTLQASWLAKDLEQDKVEEGLQALAKRLKMELKLHFAPAHTRQRMALMVTKEAHALEAILHAVRKKQIKAEPVVIISNRQDLASLARQAGLPFVYLPFVDRHEAEKKLLAVLEEHRIDFIVLARFMKILSPNFVWRWKNKILNIHPSLLPAFAGASAYRQAYEKGVKIVGVTAHFVTPDLDQGPIICQESFKVRPKETLADIVKRGQACEGKCLVHAVRLYLKNRLDVHWGRVYGV